MTGSVQNPLGRSRRRGLRTLRVRITIVAGLVITAAVIAGLIVLYILQIQSVHNTLDGQLRTYATQITQSAPTGKWPRVLPPSTLDANAEAQVISADGKVLAATRSLANLPAMYALPPKSSASVRLKAADGVIPDEARVVAVRQRIGGQNVTIVTATSTSLLTKLRSTFTAQLLLCFPLILVVAAAAVWLIVGRALRPVEEIRNAVTDITSADLSQRVPEPGTPDEIGNLAHTMNDMLQRLETSAQRQRRFVADASHELRSPLAAIRTTLEVGLAHPGQAPWPVIAERARQQSNRLEDLIQQLLLLARADEQTLALRQQTVDVAELLSDVTATTTSHDVQIRLDATEPLAILGHPDHLTRLFRNVVDNAVRYAASTVQVGAVTTARHITVRITDDGPGIPEADRDRIFNRFVRLDRSRERGSGTTGLGLAIARDITTAHQGTITATDNPAGGACFVISLPRPGATSGPDETH
ncbi:sensor histidine kinase [Streptomyces sp. NBC_00696]|uniref:sensor histidine kinase n=1 Tax=Streptomyces sp. NBC_00696 TaxID=2903672 RepID=UPI002E320F54|nr:HAMP domain-containing sensor histidine kinase [Streptomyces sp. NBC_00696]